MNYATHKLNNTIAFLTLFLIGTPYVFGEPSSLPKTVKELRYEMDVVNFDLPEEGDARLQRLAELVPHSEKLADENKNDAAFQMMAGFFNAQYAGAKGGVGALKYAKASRKYLEKSVKLDPTIYGSSAHVVLGSLYAQVPGWPIGFGDKKKAISNYKTALKLAPNGIDANFTYAQYLFGKKKYVEAKHYLQKAASAAGRPDRPKADKALREQINKGLELVEEKLADK